MLKVLFITVLVCIVSCFSGKCASAQSADGLSQAERVVAITILAEARGEGFEGMEAVACVIQQRSIERKLGVSEVCLQRLQFSCWNGKVTVDALQSQVTRKTSQEIADFAVELAQDLVAGKDLDRGMVGNANHYCTTDINPKWTVGKRPVTVIGHHKFYSL